MVNGRGMIQTPKAYYPPREYAFWLCRSNNIAVLYRRRVAVTTRIVLLRIRKNIKYA